MAQNDPFNRTLPMMLPAALSTGATATPILVLPEAVLVQFFAVLSQYIASRTDQACDPTFARSKTPT